MSEPRKSDSLLHKELPPTEVETRAETPSGEPQSALRKFIGGFSKTRKKFLAGLKHSLVGEEEIDEDLMDEVEERLLASDFGVATSRKIIRRLEEETESGRVKNRGELIGKIREIVEAVMNGEDRKIEWAAEGPTVLMFIGVNGVGKTTTIGKLAARYVSEGKKVLIAAGDTFRAAAIEQLREWSKRSGAEFYAKEQDSDPAATLFEASKKARDENFDVLLCDTSGRLHTKKNLMDELGKMKRVVKKNIPEAPHRTLLVLDANTGQNALLQTADFSEVIGVDGLIVTKLDGTAKGGVIVGIVNEFNLPVYFIGVGEKIDDLQEFQGSMIAKGIFSE